MQCSRASALPRASHAERRAGCRLARDLRPQAFGAGPALVRRRQPSPRGGARRAFGAPRGQASCLVATGTACAPHRPPARPETCRRQRSLHTGEEAELVRGRRRRTAEQLDCQPAAARPRPGGRALAALALAACCRALAPKHARALMHWPVSCLRAKKRGFQSLGTTVLSDSHQLVPTALEAWDGPPGPAHGSQQGSPTPARQSPFRRARRSLLPRLPARSPGAPVAAIWPAPRRAAPRSQPSQSRRRSR